MARYRVPIYVTDRYDIFVDVPEDVDDPEEFAIDYVEETFSRYDEETWDESIEYIREECGLDEIEEVD